MWSIQTCLMVIVLQLMFKVENLTADTEDTEGKLPDKRNVYPKLWSDDSMHQCYQCTYEVHGEDCLSTDQKSLVQFGHTCAADTGKESLHLCFEFVPKEPRVAGKPFLQGELYGLQQFQLLRGLNECENETALYMDSQYEGTVMIRA